MLVTVNGSDELSSINIGFSIVGLSQPSGFFPCRKVEQNEGLFSLLGVKRRKMRWLPCSSSFALNDFFPFFSEQLVVVVSDVTKPHLFLWGEVSLS